MIRGNTRRQLLAGAAAVVGAGLAGQGAQAAPARKPNILYIMADDLGVADLSVTGRRDYQTPVLDRLAAEGMLMTEGYANSAICSATRTALLTGRYQYRLPIGLYEPVGGPPGALEGLPDDHPTVASLLRNLGYRTSLVGKYHLGPVPGKGAVHHGYDYFFGFNGGAQDYFTHSGPYRQQGQGLFENDQPVDVPGYLTKTLTEKAIAEIERAKAMGRPFFMSLHYNAPHWPWEGPDDLERAIKIDNKRDIEGGSIEKYGEMVRYMDDCIGQVLAALRRLNLERDTIVVFTSDNGGERYSDTWPYIGYKGELLEGGMRVPVIVRWPGQIKAGSRSDQVNISMDWLPTFLAAAGGAPDPAYPSDGENLLPVLLGQAQPHPRTLFWRFRAADQSAVREGNWKYVSVGGKEYLFDLAEDARERADKKALHPEVTARLKADWAKWNAAMLPYTPQNNTEDLKALGYFADRY